MGSDSGVCPSCGKPLVAGALGGICPQCLLRLGLSDCEGGGIDGVEIDGYEILEELGEGGMGVVYLAQQTEPIERMAAVKVIKLGMDTRALVSRFNAERRALALMDHKNIAGVFDAGATSTGRPFFAMEWVDGEPIDTFCDRAELDVRGRLAHFIDVAEAVQHAHSKGVVHCDLKPSNVLVAEIDGRPVSKVIDFGIARAIDPEAGLGLTVVTEGGVQIVGTPAYMAPEQAEGAPKGVDTRVDVYSLGAMLYELLAGGPPFTSTELGATGLTGKLRHVRDKSPPRPSARAMAEGGSGRKIASDLDWIVMRAMEKDRERRYASAGQLADDVRRFLSDQPVVARPPSRGYLVWKFARRHRVGLAVGAAVCCMLAIAATVSVVQAVRAHRAEEVAVERREQSELLVSFMLEDVYGILKDVGHLYLLEGVAEAAYRHYASLPDSLGENVFIGRSNALAKIGEIRAQQGDFEASLAKIRAAYQILEPLALGSGASDRVRFEFSQRSALLGMVLRRYRDPAASEPYFRIAVDTILPLVEGGGERKMEYEGYLAGFYNLQASSLQMLGERGRARENLAMALGIRERQRQADPDSVQRRNDVAKLYGDLAKVHDDPEAASEMFRKALEFRKQITRERPLELRWQVALASTYIDLAAHERRRHRYSVALPAADEAVVIYRALLARDAENVQWQTKLARALQERTSIGLWSRRFDEFEATAREALELWEGVVAGNPAQDDSVDHVLSKNHLARILKATAQYQEAAEIFRQVRRDCEGMLVPGGVAGPLRRELEKVGRYAVQELERLEGRLEPQ